MRLLLFTILFLLSVAAFCQTGFPLYQSFGTDSTLTEIKGAAKLRHGVIFVKFSDTTAANADRIDFYPSSMIIVGDSVYIRNSVGTAWLLVNAAAGTGTTETASQGLSKIGNDIRIGTPFGGDGAPFLFNRRFELNKKILSITDGHISDSLDERFSKFQFISIDTVKVDMPDYDQMGKAAANFKRVIKFDGGYKVGNRYGHRLALEYVSKDSVRIRTDGGDYGNAVINNLLFSTPSDFTGRALVISGHGTNSWLTAHDAPSATLSKIHFNSTTDAGTNNTRMYYKGFVNAHTAYISMGNFGKADTLENMVYYGASSFTNSPSKILKSFILRPSATISRVDSAYFLYDPQFQRSWHSGNLVIGSGQWSSYHTFRNNGTTFLRDTVYTGTRFSVTDTTGVDIKVRDRTTGQEKYITASALGVGGSIPTLQQVLDAGSTLTSIEGIIAGSNSFFITGTGSTSVTNLSLVNSNTNSIHEIFTVQHNTTGTAADGIGSSIGFYNEISNGSTNETVRIYGKWSIANHLTRTAEFGIQGITNAGAMADWLRLDGSFGYLHSSDTIATRDYARSVGGGGGGSGLFPTTGMGTATGGVIGDLATFSLTAVTTAYPQGLFQIADTDGRVRLGDIDVVGNGTLIELNDDDGTLEYTAINGHTFTGAIRLSSLAGSGEGVIATDNDGDLFFTTGAAGQFLRKNAGNTALEWVTLSGGGDALTANPLSQFASTTSAQFAGVISNETGAGLVVLADAPSMSSITLAAGTASAGTAPLYYTSGTSLTTPVSGAVEYDGIVFYNTTSTGRGVTASYMFSYLASNFTMSNVNTVQPVFPTGQDVITLQASTRYRIRGKYYLTHGATSHSVGMSFEASGAGSIASIDYSTNSWTTAANTPTATQNTNNIRQATNTAINTAGANAQETIIFEGWITTGAGGTVLVTPSITFSAAPGGTCEAVANSTWIEFWPMGTSSVTVQGPVN